MRGLPRLARQGRPTTPSSQNRARRGPRPRRPSPRDSFRIGGGLPRRILDGLPPFLHACGRGSRLAFGFRSDSRIRRRRRFRLRPFFVFPATARLSRSGRDTWRRVRIPGLRRLWPCARAGNGPGRSGVPREKVLRRVRLPGKSPASSIPGRRGRGSGGCSTASRGGGDSA